MTIKILTNVLQVAECIEVLELEVVDLLTGLSHHNYC